MQDEYKHRELTDAIICCLYMVYTTLGFDFLEKVYENALLAELQNRGIAATAQSPISVFYGNRQVGEFFADRNLLAAVAALLPVLERINPMTHTNHLTLPLPPAIWYNDHIDTRLMKREVLCHDSKITRFTTGQGDCPGGT